MEQTSRGSIPGAEVAQGKRLSVGLKSSNAAINSANVKLVYHKY